MKNKKEIIQGLENIEVKKDVSVDEDGNSEWEREKIGDLQISIGTRKSFNEKQIIYISNETRDSHHIIQYYAKFGRGPGFVHDKLREFAEKNGMYWQWESPASIVLVEK